MDSSWHCISSLKYEYPTSVVYYLIIMSGLVMAWYITCLEWRQKYNEPHMHTHAPTAMQVMVSIFGRACKPGQASYPVAPSKLLAQFVTILPSQGIVFFERAREVSSAIIARHKVQPISVGRMSCRLQCAAIDIADRCRR